MCGSVLFETIFPFEAESVTQGTVHSIRDATAFRSTVSAGESASVALLTALQDSNRKICWWTACLENRRWFLPCQGSVPLAACSGTAHNAPLPASFCLLRPTTCPLRKT